MFFPAVIRVVVGVIGNILCLSLFLSPMPTFLHICKKGSVGQYSAVPYAVTFLNCMMWVLYAIPIVHPNSTWLLTVNSAGCVIEFVYLSLFVVYSDSKAKRVRLITIVLLEILLVGLLASLVLTLVHTTKLRVQIVGTIGLVTAIMMYASPLSVMKLVIKTKSVEYMPLYLSLASFGNAAVWTLYGLAPFDPYVITPSGLGVTFGLAQLILYGVYFRTTKKQMEVTTSQVEMGYGPSGEAQQGK